MRFFSPFILVLSGLGLLGCPTDDEPQSSGTDATSSGGASSADATTADSDTSGSGATSGPAPEAAECPDYETLPLDMLLVASPGQAIVGGETRDIIDTVIDEFDGTAAIGAAWADDALGALTFVQVQRLLEEGPPIERLVLHDVPGSVNDEINVETGRLIRDGGWATHVPANSEIASGAVDLFCAGVQRTAEDGARIGVHSWTNGTVEGADLPMDSPEHAMFVDYLNEMLGAPLGEEFYFFTLQAAPAADIHWMTTEELDQYQLLTR